MNNPLFIFINYLNYFVMKKNLFLIPLAALAIASCSSDETLARFGDQENLPSSEEVRIFPVVESPSTRGPLATGQTLKTTPYDEFFIFTTGYYYDKLKHYDGTPEAAIAQSENLKRFVKWGSVWGITQVDDAGSNKLGRLYWQDDNDTEAAAFNAKFTGVMGLQDMYPASDESNSFQTSSSENYNYLNTLNAASIKFRVNDSVNLQKDLLGAYTEQNQADAKKNGVALKFQHALSQICFKASYETDDLDGELSANDLNKDFPDLRVTVKEVGIVNAFNYGEVKLPDVSTSGAFNENWFEWNTAKLARTNVDENETNNAKKYTAVGTPNEARNLMYRSILANPVQLDVQGQVKVIDNFGTSVGPLLMIPQYVDAIETIPTNYTAPSSPSEKCAYLVAKVNIQRQLWEKNGTNYDTPKGWYNYYPFTGSRLTVDGTGNFDHLKEGDVNPENSDNFWTAPKEAGEITDWAYIAVPVTFDWKPGYKYTYILNFTNLAAGWIAPALANGKEPYKDATSNDPIIGNTHKPVTFVVTVQEEWQAGTDVTPQL